jgi:Pyruvate/2-oxoacid:ferredoxin oxidoreductase gamma subunit
MIPRGQADLILGLEPIEAARGCYYASKEKTTFIIDTYPIKPVYLNLLGHVYPTNEEIKSMIEPFSKKSLFVDASNICREKLGSPLYGNVMAIGVALSSGALPLKEKSVMESLRITIPRGLEENVKAFRMGLDYKA